MKDPALIGFGEAAQAFAGAGWHAFDIADRDTDYRRHAVVGWASNPEAVRHGRAVLSLVTADQALIAAQQTATGLQGGTLYFDMNSVAPQTKIAAASIIEAVGGRYVDVAIMAPVHPARLAVPLLLSGTYADEGAALLRDFGFTNVRSIGGAIGDASSIKMIRSVMVKGIEALTAEMLAAADAADVRDHVLASLGEEWIERAAYNIERMTTHGIRRAAEMEEVAKTLSALGVEPIMTRGTIVRQRALGARA